MKTLPSVLFAGLLAGWLPSVHAAVTLPPIISDHMILQKSEKTPVWGTAAPGENVTVSIDSQTAQATADATGKWKAFLNLSQSKPGPFDMTVKGANELKVSDVLVGQVWFAAGQSNMGVSVGETTDAKADIAASANPMLRTFYTKVDFAPEAPVEKYAGQWLVASPAVTGRFSAICYFFGKELQSRLNAPVGVIDSCCGGTYGESWMSPEAINSDPDLKSARDIILAAFKSYPDRFAAYAKAYEAWEASAGRQDKPAGKPEDFARPTASTADWKKVDMPGVFSSYGLPDSGVTWIRKTITVPPEVNGAAIKVQLGNIREFATVYWNGVKIGETTINTRPGSDGRFMYRVPANLVKAGPNVLAARIFTPGGSASLSASSAGYDFRVIFSSINTIQFIAGSDWLAKAEYSLPPLAASAIQTRPVEPAVPDQAKNVQGSMYNAMIHPLLPYLIRGWIWYQGESNSGFAQQYRTVFPAMIKDWRTHWGLGDLPFYFCQLPGCGPRETQPAESSWAELREAQLFTHNSVPNTGQAVLIDLGEELNIHPRNKKDAGIRLAKVVLAQTYGMAIPHEGPVFQSMQREGDKLRIRFTSTSTGGGLVAHPMPATYRPRSNEAVTKPLVRHSPESQVEGFAICGADKKWVWANATIDGTSVVVSSPQIPNPTNVRYAWEDNPMVNLFNGDGFPAAPFRTDNFPLKYTGKRVK